MKTHEEKLKIAMFFRKKAQSAETLDELRTYETAWKDPEIEVKIFKLNEILSGRAEES